MYLYFIAVLTGSFIISTSLLAVDNGTDTIFIRSDNTPNIQQNKPVPDHVKIHQHNMIFDDYSSGGIPYEPYKK